MSKGKIIKMMLIASSLCIGLYHAAQFMEVLSSAKGQEGSFGTAAAGKDPRALLSQLGLVQLNQSAVDANKQVVVFTPKHGQLSKEQQEAILREAERNRPVTPGTPTGRR